MRTLAAFAVLLFMAGCQAAPPELTEAEIAQIEAEVLQVMQVFMEGFNEHDPGKIATTLHPDLPAILYAGRIWTRAEFPEGVAPWFEAREAYQGEWIETDVRVLSRDLAVFQASYRGTTKLTDGRTFHYPHSSSMALFERTSEGWRWTVGGTSAGPAELVEGG
jgi:hypothetical protein